MGLDWQVLSALLELTYFPMYRGDLDRFLEISREMLRRAERFRVRQYIGFGHQFLTGVHFMRGEFDGFQEHASVLPQENFYVDIYQALSAELRSDMPEAVRTLPKQEKAGGARRFLGIIHGHRAHVFMHAGLLEQARAEIAALQDLAYGGQTQRSQDFESAQDALRLAPEAFVRRAFTSLSAKASTRFSVFGMASVDRVRGNLAMELGLHDEAEQHFRTGLEWCERERCPVEAGRCLQGLAEMAERRGDFESARTHLDAAGALFAEYGAKLYLDQVLAKKEILKS